MYDDLTLCHQLRGAATTEVIDLCIPKKKKEYRMCSVLSLYRVCSLRES